MGYISFKRVVAYKKTEVWEVKTVKRGELIGRIAWNARWCQYTLFPEAATVFSWDCLKLISEFIHARMDARKVK